VYGKWGDFCRVRLSEPIGCQKFYKLLNALRVIIVYPSSSTKHNNIALTIKRSRLARFRARGRNLTLSKRS
jgi:hypothetical protein